MQVTAEGQICLLHAVREKLGIVPNTEVDFIEENGRFYLVKILITPSQPGTFRRMRGIATVKMRTDEIMALTRGEK